LDAKQGISKRKAAFVGPSSGLLAQPRYTQINNMLLALLLTTLLLLQLPPARRSVTVNLHPTEEGPYGPSQEAAQ
jgi:hypothetical protein